MKIRDQELIVYRNFEESDAKLLHDMTRLMEYDLQRPQDREEVAGIFYNCIYCLLELAGNYGFYGNLWHCFLSNLLVNN